MANFVYGDSPGGVQAAEQAAANSDRNYISALIAAAQAAQRINQQQQQINFGVDNALFNRQASMLAGIRDQVNQQRQFSQKDREMAIEAKRVAGQNAYQSAIQDNWQNQAILKAKENADKQQADFDQSAGARFNAMFKDNMVPSLDRLKEYQEFRDMSPNAQLRTAQNWASFRDKSLFGRQEDTKRAEVANSQLQGILNETMALKKANTIAGQPVEPLTEGEILLAVQKVQKGYPNLELVRINGELSFAPKKPYYQFDPQPQAQARKPFRSPLNARVIQ